MSINHLPLLKTAGLKIVLLATDVITSQRPDVMIVEKDSKLFRVIDKAVPDNVRIAEREKERPRNIKI